ncbi:MAG: hypothetical protein HYR63_12165 [Proteobacteria bacterium]|nr:hypothetical protein [Pseudomonadota bacterium]MBI3500043.1 hypothetical protein [Pseudomonadota bacterium]
MSQQSPAGPQAAEFREQANVLRRLARTFDIPGIRLQLLALADQCEKLAASLEASDKEEPR